MYRTVAHPRTSISPGRPCLTLEAAPARRVATVVLYLPHTLPSLAQVTLTGEVPTSWGGAPVAQLQPPALAFDPDSFSQPQLLRLQPLGAAGGGPYFVPLTMRWVGMASCMYGFQHTFFCCSQVMETAGKGRQVGTLAWPAWRGGRAAHRSSLTVPYPASVLPAWGTDTVAGTTHGRYRTGTDAVHC